ncbi:MAG: WD40 repeat domain-containing protein [Richelia sp. SM1_7_0]|nr:WD40 repeat domain-containing protein [Richelia sp. SM1_7_0]
MNNLRDWLAEKSLEEIEHFLGEIPRLWLESRQFHKFYSLLTDYDFIEAKINHPQFGVHLLLEDYDLIDDIRLCIDRQYDIENLKILKLVRGALQLSTHILIKDTRQLPVQLSGRLLNCNTPKIQDLIQQILQSNRICLRSLVGSLTPPDSILVRTLSGHCGSINAIAVTYNNKYVISASDDTTLIVWDFYSGRELLKLSGHTASVNAVVITPDDKYIISGSSDKTIKIWDLATGKSLVTLTGHSDSVNAVIVTPDGRQIISASSDSTIKLWNMKNMNEEHSLTCNGKSLNSVTITPNGKHIVFNSNYLERLDCRTKISSDYLNVYNIQTKKIKKILSNLSIEQKFSQSIAITPDSLNAISSSYNIIYIRNIENGDEIIRLLGHNDSVNTIAASSNGKYIISGSSDKTIRVWNLKTKEYLILKGHTEAVNSVIVSYDSRYCLSASGDKTIKIWNIETEENISIRDINNTLLKPNTTPFCHTTAVTSIGISLDGRRIVSISEDKNIKVWNITNYSLTQDYFLPSEKFIFPWRQRSETINSIITQDCKWIVSRVRKHAIEAFNIQTRKTIFFKTSLGYIYDFLRFIIYICLVIVLFFHTIKIYFILQQIFLNLNLLDLLVNTIGGLIFFIIYFVLDMLIIIFAFMMIDNIENNNSSDLITYFTKKITIT